MEVQANPVRVTNLQNETTNDIEVNDNVMLDNMDMDASNVNDDFAAILPRDRSMTRNSSPLQLRMDIEHEREVAVAQAFGMDQMAAALEGIVLEGNEEDRAAAADDADDDGDDDNAVEIEWDQAEEHQDRPPEDVDDLLLQEAAAQRREELEQLIADNGTSIHRYPIIPILLFCRTCWAFTRGAPVHATGRIQSEVWALSRGSRGARSMA